MKKCLLFSLLVIVLFSGCSRIIMNKVSDALSSEGGSSVFTSDEDPELMRDALPLALKMYEALLEANPDHVDLHRATASAFCSYSYAFIQFPADTTPVEDFAEKKHMMTRAKKMYIRARDYGLQGLSIKYPGFNEGLASNADSVLALTEKEDVSILYWTALSWLGAFTAQKDINLSFTVMRAVKMMKRVEELDPNYGNGSLDEFLITFYGSMPKSLGGDKEKSKHHYERALKLSDGKSSTAHINYATAIAIPAQDRTLFVSLMKKAKKIKPKEVQDDLLYRTIQHEKAVWYLKHIDDFFIE